MSLIDLFKEFHSRAIVDVYPPSARALFDTFIFDFNAAFWPEERVYSERELSRLTGLTPATTHRSLKFLADHGHIKTKSSKRGTVVKLTGVTWSTNEAPVEHQRSTNEAPMKHPWSTCEAPVKHPDEVPIIRACEDVKTLRHFTSNDDDTRARAGVNRDFENGVTVTPTPTPLDEVEDYWSRTLKGGRLSIEHLSEIQALIDKHGVDWVKEAMRDASDANGNGLNMRLFRGVIRRKLNPVKPALKGGERRDRGNESARRNVVALPDTYDPARDPVDWRQYLTGTGTSTARP